MFSWAGYSRNPPYDSRKMRRHPGKRPWRSRAQGFRASLYFVFIQSMCFEMLPPIRKPCLPAANNLRMSRHFEESARIRGALSARRRLPTVQPPTLFLFLTIFLGVDLWASGTKVGNLLQCAWTKRGE